MPSIVLNTSAAGVAEPSAGRSHAEAGGHVAFCLMGVALWFEAWPWQLFRISLIGWQLPVGAASIASSSCSRSTFIM
jgi:hypothetical protein